MMELVTSAGCYSAVQDGRFRGIKCKGSIQKVKANTLMILGDQLECGKKGFISDLQNANYGLVTAAKLAAQTCI